MCLADIGKMMFDKFSSCFIGEETDVGKGGSVLLQSAQLLKFAIPLSEFDLFQLYFNRVIRFLCGIYSRNCFVVEGFVDVNVVVEGLILLLH